MRIFFVPVRKLSHRSFVTGQTSQSQDPDRSSLRQLMHSSSCAPAPFLLEPSGWFSLGPSSSLPPVCFLLQPPPGVWLDSAAASGLATTSLATDCCPVPIGTVLWESCEWWWGWRRLHCHFCCHSSNTHRVVAPVCQPTSPHVMGSLGRSLWHGAGWEDIIQDGPLWTGRKGSRMRRRRSCRVMPARQALPEPLWGSEPRVVCARQNDQAFYLNRDELFHVRGIWEGHNLGQCGSATEGASVGTVAAVCLCPLLPPAG